MKKKLALACSLVHSPQVVVLDEPTLGVDPVSRREFWTLLGDLRVEKGLTVLVSTPYMDEAERCNHVGLIYNGRLIASDTPAGIKQRTPGQLLEFTPHASPGSADAGAEAVLERALNLLNGLPGLVELQTYGAMLHTFVDDPALRQPQIEQALAQGGLVASGLRLIQPRMEEAFISLIQHQASSDAARQEAK